MSIVSQKELDRDFAHPPAKPDISKVVRQESIRIAGKVFALEIVRVTPASADQRAAVRKVREAVMTANAAIDAGE
jgi:hypothetical protein